MRTVIAVTSLAWVLAACTKKEAPAARSGDEQAALVASFALLPASFAAASRPVTDEEVTLGRMLFFDARLSKNHDLSCNSCHPLDRYGVDGLRVSRGHRGQTGTRNAPTVYNAAGHFAQFWDGRAADVEEQAKGPILNPVEMAEPSEAAVVATLRSIPGYLAAFQRAFPDDPDPVSYARMAEAIGAFERRLVTPSRWDRFLAGDAGALDAQERHGLQVFVSAGCVACHNGPTVGGGSFQKLGLIRPYARTSDQGRFQVTKQDADRMVFKVPSLRNVEKTGPYFHDGRIADLETAVRTMADLQLGRTLSADDTRAVVAFLRSMTGALPADMIGKPALPPSGTTTPAADPS